MAEKSSGYAHSCNPTSGCQTGEAVQSLLIWFPCFGSTLRLSTGEELPPHGRVQAGPLLEGQEASTIRPFYVEVLPG